MNFINREHFNILLKNLKPLGIGSQGMCFLDEKHKIVYKVFHEYFDYEKSNYKEEEILRFSHIDNKTFIWPKDVLIVKNEIVGYTMPYVKSKNLYERNPLLINLDSLETAIQESTKDIKLLTDNKVAMYDVMYNILYRNGKIAIIDTMEYGTSEEISLDKNMLPFNYELKLFLVDNYFNNFITSSRLLNEMYTSNANCLEFLKQFRTSLSNYLEEPITTLNQAKMLIRKNPKPKYIRSINNKDNY